MRKHPAHGARILANIKSPLVAAVLPGVQYHHEKWDGSGYPEGLSGSWNSAPRTAARRCGLSRRADVGARVSRAEAARRSRAAHRARARACSSIPTSPRPSSACTHAARSTSTTRPELGVRRRDTDEPTCCCRSASASWPRSERSASTPPIAVRFHHLHYRVAGSWRRVGRRGGGVRGDAHDPSGARRWRSRRHASTCSSIARAGRTRAAGAAVPRTPTSRRLGGCRERESAWRRPRSLRRPWRVDGVRGRSITWPLPRRSCAGACRDQGEAARPPMPIALVSRSPSGLGVEIVRDTTLPDVWWCPMHVDVRSPTGGSCPICSMALVPIPPPRVGEYTPGCLASAAARRRVVRVDDGRSRP